MSIEEFRSLLLQGCPEPPIDVEQIEEAAHVARAVASTWSDYLRVLDRELGGVDSNQFPTLRCVRAS